MPARPREPPLLEGDVVSVAVRQFGEEYARSRGGRQWASENVRDEGTVVEKHNSQYLVDFGDGEERRWWARRLLRFVSRNGSQAVSRRAAQDSDDEGSSGQREEEDDGSEWLGGGSASSEDEEEDDGDDVNHEEEDESTDLSAQGAAADVDGWLRNDEQFVDERQKHGWNSNSSPVWNACPATCLFAEDGCDVSSYFFDVCLSWFPEGFFKQMSELMQETGRSKGQLWASWKVSIDDLWQFVGVWYYMLAFEEVGSRRNYFAGWCEWKARPLRPKALRRGIYAEGQKRSEGSEMVRKYVGMLRPTEG